MIKAVNINQFIFSTRLYSLTINRGETNEQNNSKKRQSGY
jgi:hypothetical protein